MPFAAYPSAVVYSEPGEKNRKNAVQQVIWGDWITLQGPPQSGWIPVERSIAIYGLINLRTDGKKAMIAQKLEKPISNAEKWDIHLLEPGPDGRLRYAPK
jgi:hypothetical protein